MFCSYPVCGLRPNVQSSEMTKITKNSNRPLHTTSFDQETEMQDLKLQPSRSQAQFVPAMYMPYIEGPKVDWTVTDGLYHRFLKWKLKCENNLDCKLAMLPKSRSARKSYLRVWYVSICVMVLASCRSKLGHNLVQI